MYFLCGQWGLISITLLQNGINSPSTSLQGHRFSQSNEMSGGSVKSSLIIAPALLFRCVLQHPFYLPPFLNLFPAENEFLSSHSEHRDYRKLQARKSITDLGCVIQNAECLSPSCACHLHAYCLQCYIEMISLGEEPDWSDTVLTAALWYFTAAVNHIIDFKEKQLLLQDKFKRLLSPVWMDLLPALLCSW